MNRPAVLKMNGAAILRSFLYRPGEMKDQIWYTIHGDARKIEQSTGSLIQMMEKLSIGAVVVRRGGTTFKNFSASTAGCLMMSHNWDENTMLAMNAIPTPQMHLMIRERSSSRCSMKDIRSMPSSSPSPSSGG